MVRYPPPALFAVGVAALLLAPLFSFLVFAQRTIESESIQRAADDQLRTARLAAHVLSDTLADAGSNLNYTVARGIVPDAMEERDLAGLQARMSDLLGSPPRYAGAAAIDPGGNPLARAPETTLAGNLAARDYFLGAAASDTWFVSEAFMSTATGKSVVAVSRAVRVDDEFLGVIVVTLDESRLAGELTPLNALGQRELLIVDRAQRLVASTNPERTATSPVDMAAIEPDMAAVAPNVFQWLSSAASSRAPSIAGVVRGSRKIVSHASIPNSPWVVFLVDDRQTVLAPEANLSTRLVGAGVVAAGAALLLTLVTALLYSAQMRHRNQLVRSEAQLAATNGRLEGALATEHAANEELERLSQAKNDFVSTVTHEFRTPLTGILGFSEMIQTEDLGMDEMKEFAGDINKDARRLARLVNDMLDLNRMESGYMSLNETRFDLNALLQETVDQMRATAPRHSLVFDADPAITTLTADSDRLTQVITNLLNNAIKYSPEGGEIVVRTRLEGGGVHLKVSDQGLGMPPEALDAIFERYTRIKSDAARFIQGTGLGLPIVRQIVDMHGGRVWAESTLGKGSTFHVVIPAQSANGASGLVAA